MRWPASGKGRGPVGGGCYATQRWSTPGTAASTTQLSVGAGEEGARTAVGVGEVVGVAGAVPEVIGFGVECGGER